MNPETTAYEAVQLSAAEAVRSWSTGYDSGYALGLEAAIQRIEATYNHCNATEQPVTLEALKAAIRGLSC